MLRNLEEDLHKSREKENACLIADETASPGGMYRAFVCKYELISVQ